MHKIFLKSLITGKTHLDKHGNIVKNFKNIYIHIYSF